MPFEKEFSVCPDELIIKRGEGHKDQLVALIEKLKENFSGAKLAELFNEKTQAKLDDFVFENYSKLNQDLAVFFEDLPQMESTRASGHGFAHALDNVNSSLRIFNEYDNLKESEKLEIILACSIHDLGRFAEPELKSIFEKKDLAILLPAFVGRMFERKLGHLPPEFNERILFDIWSGSEAKTGYRTADIVHQCDREQLMDSVIILRGLAFGVGIDRQDLQIPLLDEFKYKLPTPESEPDRYLFVRCEFFMRNLYPSVSPQGEQFANNNKLENAAILMLALEGKSEEYFKQVFGPELGLVKQGEAEVHQSKRPIPPEIFERAQKSKDEFLIFLKKTGLTYQDDISWLVDFTKRAIATDKMTVPPDINEILEEKFQKCNLVERKNTWMILNYALKKRHEKRIADLARLKNISGRNDFQATVAQAIIHELGEREEIFKSNPDFAKLG